MATGWRDPVGRRRDDTHVIQPVTNHGAGYHFARQCTRNEDRAVSDTVAEVAQSFYLVFRQTLLRCGLGFVVDIGVEKPARLALPEPGVKSTFCQ